MPPITEEQQKKIKAFMDEYGELVKKHQCDFIAYPMFVPDGQGGFKITIQQQAVDTSNLPQKSPISLS